MEKLKRGRKPIEDKAKGVRIYMPQSSIDKLGGYQSVQELMYAAVNRKLNRLSGVQK